MSKVERYKRLIGQEGFSNGFNNRAIQGKLEQVEALKDSGIVLGYFEDGTVLNMEVIKKDGNYLEN